VQAFCLKRRKDVLEQVFSDSIFDLFSKPDKNFSRYQAVEKRKKAQFKWNPNSNIFFWRKTLFYYKDHVFLKI
jgi:hypothetical protein